MNENKFNVGDIIIPSFPISPELGKAQRKIHYDSSDLDNVFRCIKNYFRPIFSENYLDYYYPFFSTELKKELLAQIESDKLTNMGLESLAKQMGITQKVEALEKECHSSNVGTKLLFNIINQRNDIPPVILTEINKHLLFINQKKASRLLIDSEYRIFLPDYNNIEITMTAMPKALFLLFLNHPEGILLKNIDQHKAELHKIYLQLSNFTAPQKIKQQIDDIVDPANFTTLNTNICRIKSAFTSKISELWAKEYYVDGERGEKKQITLNRNLIIKKR